MAVKIRLRRMGRKKHPVFALVAADGRSPRDGRFIEDLGRYEPVREPATVSFNEDRVLYWLQQGAQPSDTVRNLLSQQGLMLRLHLLRKGKTAEEIEEAVAAFHEARGSKEEAVKMTAADRRREAIEAERQQAEAEAKQREEERKAREAELARQKAEAEAKAREEAEAARKEAAEAKKAEAEAAKEEAAEEADKAVTAESEATDDENAEAEEETTEAAEQPAAEAEETEAAADDEPEAATDDEPSDDEKAA